MEKEIAINLIKLDILDRTSSDESEALQFFKNDNDFPFEILGNYQNLLAIIAATSGLSSISDELKNQIFTQIYSIKNFKQTKETKVEEEILKQIEEEIKQVQNIDVHLEESFELVEASVETLPAAESRKKPSIEELKLSRGGIKLKDPNFSNIHLIMEDRKSRVAKEKEVPVSKKEPEKIEVVTKPVIETVDRIESPADSQVNVNSKNSEIKIELTKVDKRSQRKRNSFLRSRGVPLRRDRSKLLVVSVVLVTVSFFAYLLIENSQTSPVEIAQSKPLAGNVEINHVQTQQPTQTIAEEIVKEDLSKKSETIVNEKPVGNIQPSLPEPPKLIETPIEEMVENNKTITFEDIKEKSIDLPMAPPVENKKLEIESPYFVAVEEMPEPIGGLAAIQSRIVYPEIARRAGVEGKVFVLAYVDEKGKVTSAEIVKGIGSGCDESAMDAVMATKFKPGIQRGKPVKVKITIPIVFKR